MNIKKVGMALGLTGVLLLAACGEEETSKPKESNEAENQTTEQSEQPAEQEQAKKEDDGSKYMDGLGTVTPVGVAENGEQSLQFGPMNLDISRVLVVDIEADEDSWILEEGVQNAKAIVVDMKAENTEARDIDFYPNQAVMVTDTGSQVESEMMLMGDAGGEFLGQVKKEGQTWWIIKDTADISTVKMIIGAPSDTESWEDIGEEQRIEFNFIGYDEAKEQGINVE